ncbi:diguanylate cyclase [Wohlfahrtiimonas chitiniclastica]|uniref:PAS domain-containing protein n=1 Tax=Wohlfahrtiimonas chitiniclastica TaxID=400946 RepID=UPI000B99B9C7|nr:PAS domain-containing protein [Wohlfahrtiimonas chitiniclastica]OYQ88592.1 diguanylate cyclase [Wohlfahrtiimonas chitiniclastica]
MTNLDYKTPPNMELSDLPEGVTEYEEKTLTYYDGSTRRIYVVDEEVPYPDGRLIVSRTNTDGIITHANQAFVDMSAWTEEELIGSPHSILRHPDVPPVIFQDLWNTVQSGQPWRGFVKNLRKDGRYYWVYATASPNYDDGHIIAYTSVRRKPSQEGVNQTLKTIAKLWAAE